MANLIAVSLKRHLSAGSCPNSAKDCVIIIEGEIKVRLVFAVLIIKANYNSEMDEHETGEEEEEAKVHDTNRVIREINTQSENK